MTLQNPPSETSRLHIDIINSQCYINSDMTVIIFFLFQDSTYVKISYLSFYIYFLLSRLKKIFHNHKNIFHKKNENKLKIPHLFADNFSYTIFLSSIYMHTCGCVVKWKFFIVIHWEVVVYLILVLRQQHHNLYACLAIEATRQSIIFR